MKRETKRLVVRIEDDTSAALESKTSAQGITLTAFIVAVAEFAATEGAPLDPNIVRRAREIDTARRRRAPNDSA